MGPVIVDTNLLLLLIVGSTHISYVSMHERLGHYDETDFETLTTAISLFSDIVLLPHILAEVSSLSRQIKNPARARIQRKFRQFVETTPEIMVPSRDGALRAEFHRLGLTDAVLLHVCAPNRSGVAFSLLTVDNELAVAAEMLGYDVLNFRHLR